MGLDFDAAEYCKNLKGQHSPPFNCPVEKCDKFYKSLCGLQYHLVNYDHDNPTQPVTPFITPNRKRGRARLVGATPKAQKSDVRIIEKKEAVTFCENENLVQYDIDGKSIKVSAVDELPIISDDDYQKLLQRGDFGPTPEVPPEPHLKLPEASFKEIENYNICDAPARPNAYIRFIEKSAEELDGEVEYDVDEEDTTWLSIINERRQTQGINPVSTDTLELLMDRLEKESYFQAAANGQSGVVVDDDAVCCICMDGECQNTNVILFCDMCNLAVHQDCYGVPYIPEGQWLCRRCLQSPSTPVSCVLCPNTGGAFKQTDRGDWAHVVCALWIPEVRFANTVFLEPIDSIETIPPARWRLTCYVCKEKGIGACIQCQRNNCYAAFHVTCAQQAGLHMTMDTVKDSGNEAHPVTVQKSAYCHAHTPADAKNDGDGNAAIEKLREDTRHKMKEARKLLAKKRSSVPVILIPTIPPNRMQEITGLVNVQKKAQFIQRLIAYWTLKRQYRNGVPLLRRLQSQGQNHGGISRNGIEGSPNTSELYQQLKYWQCLRQDLERARLLCELVRKREKLKAASIKTMEQVIMIQLNPLEAAMNKLLDMLLVKDTTEIFLEPVDVDEVPDYRDIVKHPMDLGTMRKKLKSGEYRSLDQMEADFDLMIRNCLAYNNKDTIFYRAGIRMRDQGGPIFKMVRKELEREGIVDQPKSDDCISQELDGELKELLQEQPTDDIVQKMLILVDKAQALRNGTQRTKRVKQIRAEMAKIRKIITKAKNAAKLVTDSSQSDGETKAEIVIQTPPCSPLKSANNSASPSGVNRRTAVLFTRKAQAALKKPDPSAKEESSCDTPVEIIKSPKRTPKNKRLSNRRSVESDAIQIDNKNKSPIISPNHLPTKEVFETIPDSFRVYRANANREISDTEESDLSDFSCSPCSSCTGFSVSGTGSDFDSSYEDCQSGCYSEMSQSDNEQQSEQQNQKQKKVQHSQQHQKHQPQSQQPQQQQQQDANISALKEEEKIVLEPLQLVWAKCRGYPWYPALIIDPKIPRGFVYNGVPLPAPSQHILNLRKNHTDEVFLVLFFDAKRTWQWLPSTKLELLGVSKELDQSKLVESRKPTDRKAVKKAYQDALHYQSQVSDLEGQGPGAIM